MAAAEPVRDGPAARGECDPRPGDLRWREGRDLDRFRVGPEGAADYEGLECDHDDRGLQAGVEADDLARANLETGLLERLPDRALGDRLVDLEEAAWLRPAPVAGLDAAPDQDDLAGLGHRDRGDDE